MGDEASAYIVRHLTPNTVVRVGIPSTIKKSFFDVLRSIKSCKQPSLKSFFRTLFDNTPFLVSLGSIITYSNKHGIIWGSGFQTKEYKFNGGILLAVRGYETVKELKHRGITPPHCIGDPGLLMPLIFRPHVSHTCDIGLIPHIREYDSVRRIADKYGYKAINMETDDVEGAISEILQCRCILSSSLHGLIFAQSYGIPALFFIHEHKGEGLFKYNDYFGSVGIKSYMPYDLKQLIIEKGNELSQFIINHNEANIKEDLINLQRFLLSVAPFPMYDSFEDKIEQSLSEEIEYLRLLKERD